MELAIEPICQQILCDKFKKLTTKKKNEINQTQNENHKV